MSLRPDLDDLTDTGPDRAPVLGVSDQHDLAHVGDHEPDDLRAMSESDVTPEVAPIVSSELKCHEAEDSGLSRPHTCPGFLGDPPEVRKALDDGGFWIGCENPERPPDSLMVTFPSCPPCAIAHEAAERAAAWPSVLVTTAEDCLAVIEARTGRTP